MARPIDIAGAGDGAPGEGFDMGAYEWDPLETPTVGLQQILNHILGIQALPEALSSDADKNGDGEIDVGDVVTILSGD